MNFPKATVHEIHDKLEGTPLGSLFDLLSDFSIHYLWEKRWFFISLAVGAVMILAPVPEGLTKDGMIVLAMSVMATIMFITEPIPLPGVALLIVPVSYTHLTLPTKRIV